MLSPSENLLQFEDNIIRSGTVKCMLYIPAKWRNLQILQSISVLHNFDNQTTYVIKVTAHNECFVLTINGIHQKPNRSLIISEIELKNGHTMSQHIHIQLTNDEKLNYSFKIISTFYFHQKALSQKSQNHTYWKEKQYTIPITVRHNDILKYTLYRSVIDGYNLYLPNGVLSTIFDKYDSKYFHIYGEPFICDTLELDESRLHRFQILPYLYLYPPGTGRHPHQGHMLFTDSNQLKRCEISGFGILKKTEEFHRRVPFESRSLWKLLELKKKRNMDIYLLLDVKVHENDKFMLWIDGNIETTRPQIVCCDEMETTRPQIVFYDELDILNMNNQKYQNKSSTIQRIKNRKMQQKYMKRRSKAQYKTQTHFRNVKKQMYHRW